MKHKHNPLTTEQIQTLSQDYDVLSIPQDFELVYEEQVPNTSVALISGELELFRKRKTLERIDTPALYGAQNLLDNEPVKLGCKVKKDSQVIFLGKSELKELLEKDHVALSPLIRKK